MQHNLTLQNNRLRMVLSYGEDLLIQELTNVPFSQSSNQNLSPFTLFFRGKELHPCDFDIELCANITDNTQQLVTFLLTNQAQQIKVRLHFINDLDATITVLYQVWDDYKDQVPYNMEFHSPLLAALSCGDQEQITYLPAMLAQSKQGKRLVCPLQANFGYGDANPPYVTCEKNNQYGFSVLFPTKCDVNDNGSQNRNVDFFNMSTISQIKNHRVRINPDSSFNDAVEFAITGLVDGWREAFDRFRTAWSMDYDFSQYDRADLQWIKDTCIHNFSFLYGDEAFDHQAGKIDVDRLLEAGQEFGGYDTVTFWNQYPRLGLDDRDQWDFHSQLPFGREDEKRAVDAFHKQGVKVFMPFIPWDQHPDKSANQTGDDFAKLLADTGADGYQLDTMSTLPYSYRTKTDAVRDGLIMQTQSHPEKKHYLEFLTSSWDEFWYDDAMPETDLLRYLLPQHISPVISRWLRKEDKDMIIKRAMFGGAGMVIWQDIFGRWMPFSKEQKSQIARWKELYMANRDIYLCPKPTPIYPTLQSDVYCNLFEGERGTIYSLYNDSDSVIQGNICNLANQNKQLTLLFGGELATVNNGAISVCMQPKEVVHLLATSI